MGHEPDAEPGGTFAGETRAGESVADEFRVGDAVVGVTDQRLLVRHDGQIRAVDLTNVREVKNRRLSDRGRLLTALQWTALGAFLLLSLRVVPLEGFIAPVGQAPGGAFEDLYDAVNVLVDALRFVDEAFLVVAVLSLGWAAWQVFEYVRGWRRVLEVTVAGADPIRLPRPADSTAPDRLRGAITARADTDRNRPSESEPGESSP